MKLGLTEEATKTANWKGKAGLEEDISKSRKDTKKEMIENLDFVYFNGKSIPLKTEKLK